MSESTSESSGTVSGMPSEVSLVTEGEILVAESSLAELARMAAQGEIPAAIDEGDQLAPDDVLATEATDPNLGAFLTLDEIGGNTVLTVETVGAPVQMVTLEGVTGVTLQQLLNDGLAIG